MTTPIFRLPPYRVQTVLTTLAESIDWGLRFCGIPDAWTQSQGAGVTVAVLDTGCDARHADLRGAVLASEDFSGSHHGAQDVQGHGTHCAGIVAARRNETGVVGVAPQASLMVGKVLGDDGTGSSAVVARGVLWALAQGADVISMSLGSPEPSSDLRHALEEAVGAGKFVVCAAGNDGLPDSVGYPAAWDDLAVAVGAIGRDGALANFSSRGRQVDVCAPGVDVLSCWPGGRYAKLSGTSMATPFVAGVVALLLARQRSPGAAAAPRNQAELIERLQRTAIDAGPAGPDPSYGFGLIHPRRLLEEAKATPGSAGVLVFGPFAALGYSWTVRGEPVGQA